MQANDLTSSGGAGEPHDEDTAGTSHAPPRWLTYLGFINYFWDKDLEFSFSSDEVALFFRLLKRANQLKKPRFNLAIDKLMAELGLKTKRPLDTARKALREAGLLEFQNGNGRGCTTEYIFPALTFTEKREDKNIPFSAPLSDTLSAQFPHSFRTENALLHKSKRKSREDSSAAHAAAENLIDEVVGKKPKRARATAAEIAGLSLPHPSPEFVQLWADFLTSPKQAKKRLEPLSFCCAT